MKSSTVQAERVIDQETGEYVDFIKGHEVWRSIEWVELEEVIVDGRRVILQKELQNEK